jgi:hypothetical protein
MADQFPPQPSSRAAQLTERSVAPIEQRRGSRHRPFDGEINRRHRWAAREEATT